MSIRNISRPPPLRLVVALPVVVLVPAARMFPPPVRFVESFAPPRPTTRCLGAAAATRPSVNSNKEQQQPAPAPAPALGNNPDDDDEEEEECTANKLRLLQHEIEAEKNQSILRAAAQQQQQHDDDGTAVASADDVSVSSFLMMIPGARGSNNRNDDDSSSRCLDPYQRCLVLFGTAALLACGWNALLRNEECGEWFQAWRYAWPMLGGLFAADFAAAAALSCYSDDDSSSRNDSLLRLHQQPNWIRGLNAVAGVGLLVGGAYDALMPVWMTGPNVVTAAGIGQDSAALLCFLTAVGAVSTTTETTNNGNNKEKDKQQQQQYAGANSIPAVLSHAVLLSQLYILGDSAFQDVLSGTAFS